MSDEQPNPFTGIIPTEMKEVLDSVLPSDESVGNTSDEEPKVEESSPEIVIYEESIVYIDRPRCLDAAQVEELKRILKDAGADSSSQITALARIREVVEK